MTRPVWRLWPPTEGVEFVGALCDPEPVISGPRPIWVKIIIFVEGSRWIPKVGYLDNMKLSSTWGDGTMITTAMRFYERPIFVFSKLESRPSIISYSGLTAEAKPIFLGYTESAKGQGLNH